jgi:hypothetical protein
MCHREEPKHVLKDFPLLKLLNLKLIHVPPAVSKPTPDPAASAPVAAPPSPGGRVATADLLPLSGSTGIANAPSGLMACLLDVLADFNSDDNSRWDGDESGSHYIDCKSNKSVTFYPLCCSIAVSLLQHVNTSALPTASSTLLPLPSNDCVISLLRRHCQLIQRVSHSSIGVLSSKRFALLWPLQGPPTTCFRIKLPSYQTNPSPTFKCKWAIILSSQSWVEAPLLSPSMVSVSSSAMPSTSPGSWCPSTACTRASPNVAAHSMEHTKLGCLSVS